MAAYDPPNRITGKSNSDSTPQVSYCYDGLIAFIHGYAFLAGIPNWGSCESFTSLSLS